jgi:hypothetical protein
MANNVIEKDELSLKDLILKIRRTISYLATKWKILLVVGLLGAVLGGLYAINSSPNYTAEVSFVLSSESKSSYGLMGLASQFGLDVGGMSNSDVFSGDNITALMSSQLMVQQVLFKKPPGTPATLINLIVEEKGFQKKWLKKDYLKKAFPFPEHPDQLTPVQDSLVREVYEFITKKCLNVSKPDKKQSIFIVSTVSPNEKFSVFLTNYLVEQTAEFYIATKTKLAKQNLNMLQHEADSLRSLLGGAIASTAAAIDQTFNLNPAFQIRRSSAQQNQFNATVVGTAYGEVVKNLEVAKITLQKETPLFQIIDKPVIPLKVKKASVIISVLLGVFLAVAISSLFLIAHNIYQRILMS